MTSSTEKEPIPDSTSAQASAPEKKEPYEFRLSRYYLVVDIIGIFSPFLIGLFMFFYPVYFPWVTHPLVMFWSFILLVIFQAVDFLLFQTFHKKIFFHLSRYIYVLFFTAALYSTGGTQSTFLFVMMFPIVVSAVDLNPAMTKRIGFAVCIALIALLFTEPAHLHDPVYIIQHSIHVLLFAFLAYFMYKLVRETLLQKYEKEETNRKFTQLIQIDQLKNDFLSVAQHQLRTPLSGIKWALESIRSDPGLSEENKELIKSGVERTNDAIGIVNEMLKTAEAGKGSLVLSLEPVNVVSLVKDILRELNYVAIHKEVSVAFDAPDSIIAKIDVRKLKPSFTNIIDNSLKYSPRGHVKVSLADVDTNFILTVADNGIGISDDDQQFMFSRLYRGKNAISLEPDESGVGLYTAKRMIELHGGSIKLESKLGKGTTITVRLPK